MFFLLIGRVLVFFCCLGGGRVFFAVWAGGIVFVFLLFGRVAFFFLLFGRGTGVHSLTGPPGSSFRDLTTKKTKQQKKNTGSAWGAGADQCLHVK